MTEFVKPRVVKDYEKLDPEIQEQIKLEYPYGFEKKLVKFINKEGRKVSALPFETEEKYYLVRMTLSEAIEIILADDDYDDDGNLKKHIRTNYEDKYSDDEDDDDDDDDEDDEFDEDLDPINSNIDPNDLADELADDR